MEKINTILAFLVVITIIGLMSCASANGADTILDFDLYFKDRGTTAESLFLFNGSIYVIGKNGEKFSITAEMEKSGINPDAVFIRDPAYGKYVRISHGSGSGTTPLQLVPADFSKKQIEYYRKLAPSQGQVTVYNSLFEPVLMVENKTSGQTVRTSLYVEQYNASGELLSHTLHIPNIPHEVEKPTQPCVDECMQLSKKGQLRQGVTVDECIKLMCKINK